MTFTASIHLTAQGKRVSGNLAFPDPPSINRHKNSSDPTMGRLNYCATGSNRRVSRAEQQFDLQNLGGIKGGGAVGVWFLIAGLTWLEVLVRLPRPTLRAVGLGVALFAILWIAFGAMAQVVWLQWWLIPIRLRVWLPVAIACFPCFLAAGIVQQNIEVDKRLLWWLGQSIVLIGGFMLTLNFLPQLQQFQIQRYTVVSALLIEIGCNKL